MNHDVPVHRLCGVPLEPEHEVDVIVGVFRKDITGKIGDAVENGFDLTNGNWNKNENSSTESFFKVDHSRSLFFIYFRLFSVQYN